MVKALDHIAKIGGMVIPPIGKTHIDHIDYNFRFNAQPILGIPNIPMG